MLDALTGRGSDELENRQVEIGCVGSGRGVVVVSTFQHLPLPQSNKRGMLWHVKKRK
jgi:hypothetical protein